MEEGATNAKTATKSAMSEISGAIISITLVMSAVFIPVSFISGSSGVFYQQFGITLAIAILISAVNALTLSPALAALFLKPHNPSEEHKKGLKQRFFTAFNTGFDTITDKYVGSVKVFAKNKWLTIGCLVVFTVLTIFMFKTTPTGFIPNEDKGIIFADVTMPPGTTLEETQKTVKQLDSIYESMDIVKARMNITGFSILNSVNGGSYGFSVIRLQDWEERTEPSQTVEATIGQLFAKTAGLKNARIFFFTPPAVRGFGNSAGFELNLQNKDAEDWQSIGQTTNEFLAALNARPEVQYAITSFNPNFPQYELQVDIEKTKSAGLAVTDVFNAMQGYYGGLYTTDFNKFGKQYRVMIQAKPEDRANEESLNHIFVTNANGESVAVSQFVSLQKIYGPEIVSRFNLLNSVKINGAMNPGYSTGDAITAIEEVSAQVLPNNYTYEYSGLTKEENSAGSQTIIIFILSLVFVYFLLSAQYDLIYCHSPFYYRFR